MEKKFTPAPWVINSTKAFINKKGIAITDEKDRLIALVSHNLKVIGADEYVANSFLVRSAPEVLDALEKLIEHRELMLAKSAKLEDMKEKILIINAKKAIAQAYNQ